MKIKLQQQEGGNFAVENQTTPVMSFREAAAYLRVSVSTFRRYLNKNPNSIHYRKIDRKYVFTRESLDAWLRAPEQ